MSDGSAGWFGSPTRPFRCGSKYTVVPPRARIWAGSPMFGTAAMTPGCAKSRQNGTLPSAKSNQYGAPVPGSVHSCRSAGGVVGTGSALASVVLAKRAAATASRTPTRLTGKTVARRPGEPGLRSQTVYDLRLGVERRVHLRDLLRLAGLVRGRRL